MKKAVAVLIPALFVAGPGLRAQETGPSTIAQQEAGPSAAADAQGSDEAALRALVDEFTRAFDAGDATAAAATYTETAIVVDEYGERVEGRAAIQDRYAASFADDSASTIAIEVESLRFLSPETALEEGRATITPAKGGGSPEITRFTAIYVKQEGKWLQAAVRDELTGELQPHQRLQELDWLLGEWVNESQDAVVHTTCNWANGGNFLDRTFTMKTQGQPVLAGTQRFGWDPLKKQFKTWMFDSEGGHGEGYMTNNGDQWVIKVEGVSADGRPASATNIVTRHGKDRMSWQSVDRTLGGSVIPEIAEFVIVRKPPEVGK